MYVCMALLFQEDKKNVHNHDDGDTVSLFVFGEDEQDLANEAERNDGVVPYQKIRKHHFSEITSRGKNVRFSYCGFTQTLVFCTSNYFYFCLVIL